jgi:hypothetical protein
MIILSNKKGRTIAGPAFLNQPEDEFNSIGLAGYKLCPAIQNSL